MRKIFGRPVFDSIEELVQPAHTALIVVDMQNDFCSPKGLSAAGGTKIVANNQAIIKPLATLIAKARTAGVTIVYTLASVEKNLASMTPGWLYYSYRPRPLSGGKTASTDAARRASLKVVEGTWGHRIVDGLPIASNDVMLVKYRPSAFLDTNLERTFQGRGIKTIVVTGTATAGCVLATARDGQFRDYYTVVVTDCVADRNESIHKLGLDFLSDRCDAVASRELNAIWSKKSPAR